MVKLCASEKFNLGLRLTGGYALMGLLAAAEPDMMRHMLPADAPQQDPDAFGKSALGRKRSANQPGETRRESISGAEST